MTSRPRRPMTPLTARRPRSAGQGATAVSATADHAALDPSATSATTISALDAKPRSLDATSFAAGATSPSVVTFVAIDTTPNGRAARTRLSPRDGRARSAPPPQQQREAKEQRAQKEIERRVEVGRLWQ